MWDHAFHQRKNVKLEKLPLCQPRCGSPFKAEKRACEVIQIPARQPGDAIYRVYTS